MTKKSFTNEILVSEPETNKLAIPVDSIVCLIFSSLSKRLPIAVSST
ncbi:hypothetical protein [Mycoplasmopsis cynos]|nr:hypothetical protein [Mycoplasmopsis cynos]UWV77412.1 hypothetical protein NW070_00200 [Mycoplasmopsis cynos]UWV81720.1 hypothetical protein NW065_00960 [Mycoplasmopsis cynos]UWV92121.1 hypothetical protein NWE57_04275 [Mycoplasmopsis cynos]